MTTKAIRKALLDRAAAEISARNDAIDHMVEEIVARGRCDAPQLAAVWAEQLRFVYSKIPEKIYPELTAVNGKVLPIDTSVPATATSWNYLMVDSGGFVDWIDEEGDVMHSTWITTSKFKGEHAEMGGGYEYTIFDLETAAAMNMPLDRTCANAVRKAHDEKTEWVWMCGDAAKNIPGLLTHPNIPHVAALLNAGNTSRLIANKTDAEALADFIMAIDAVAQNSIEAHHTVKVLMPFSMIRAFRARFIANTADGMVTLWDRLLELYSGDDSGQGKVTFVGSNMCDASRRINPKTGIDDSGIEGDVVVLLPADDVDSLAFIRSRPFTQLAPQEENFKIKVLTHSKIGGVKVVYPLSVAILRYGTT